MQYESTQYLPGIIFLGLSDGIFFADINILKKILVILRAPEY